MECNINIGNPVILQLLYFICKNRHSRICWERCCFGQESNTCCTKENQPV